MIKNINNNNMLRKIIINILKCISIINSCLPKNNRYIFFYDSREGMFTDNSRAIFNYLISNNYNRDYKMVVALPNCDKISFLEEYNNVKVVSRVKGILYFLISKYAFYSYGSLFIKPSNDQIVVNLWHGTPLKKIEHLLKSDRAAKEDRDYFTYLLSPSENFKDVLSKAFGCDSKKIMISGYPRNDYLFSKKDSLMCLGIKKRDFNKIFLWMPTFRVSKDKRFSDGIETETGLPLFAKREDLKRLNIVLKNENALLIIKAHPMAFVKNVELSNIRSVNDDIIESKGLQLYELVASVDALITDYSSIFYDFLLMDKPIGFIIDDIDVYLANRGFIFEDPLNYMPGVHIKTKDNFYIFLNDTINNIDNYKENRDKIKKHANFYSDNNNCKRILTNIGIR